MDTVLLILVIGIPVGLYFWTFRMSDKTAGVLHKGLVTLIVVAGAIGLLLTCMQSVGNRADRDDGDRYYRR